MPEHWLEVNLNLCQDSSEAVDRVTLDVVGNSLLQLEESNSILTFHFFCEPPTLPDGAVRILWRIRFSKGTQLEKSKALIRDNMLKVREILMSTEDSDVLNESYPGEAENFGPDGWEIVQKFFEYGSRVALYLIEHRQQRISLPRDFNESKLVHCFLNQSLHTYNAEVQFYLDRLRGLALLLPDLNQYIPRLNDGAPEEFYQRLVQLSGEISQGILDDHFPRSWEGQKINGAFENVIWASALLAAAWLGWILKSKAISHYGVSNPQEEALLWRGVVPSVIDAFLQGVKRAMKEKGVSDTGFQ